MHILVDALNKKHIEKKNSMLGSFLILTISIFKLGWYINY